MSDEQEKPISEKLKRFGDAVRKLAARKAAIEVLQRSLDGINQARKEIADRLKAESEGGFDLTNDPPQSP